MPDSRASVSRWRKVIPAYRTVMACGRVALAKLGHDPHGMDLRDRPWREVVRLTWRAYRDFHFHALNGERDGRDV